MATVLELIPFLSSVNLQFYLNQIPFAKMLRCSLAFPNTVFPRYNWWFLIFLETHTFLLLGTKFKLLEKVNYPAHDPNIPLNFNSRYSPGLILDLQSPGHSCWENGDQSELWWGRQCLYWTCVSIPKVTENYWNQGSDLSDLTNRGVLGPDQGG